MSEILRTVPKGESINPHESFDSFHESMKTEYGQEFVLTVIGFSKENYQELTPFGVNYEKTVREFVKRFPSYSRGLKKDYESGTGKPHRILEKAIAQNDYLEQLYQGGEVKSTDLSTPEDKRVYYDPDGYPNLQIDPSFYAFYREQVEAGVTKKQEILTLFSQRYPDKASGYKVLLPNKEKWETKDSKSEKLAETIREQGIDTSAIKIDCNGTQVEAIVFNKEPSTEKLVRVYRGVVSADQTILRQLPYGARGVIEHNDPNPENSHNYITSTIQEVPGIEEDIAEMAKNPSMDVIQRYADKMRVYFKEKNMTQELEHLESTLIKFSKGVIEGTSIESMLSLEQVSGGMYTAQYLMAPYVSATPNLNEAWNYGRGGVIVYEIPESELKNLNSRNECMMNGIIDEKYINMFVFNSSGVQDASQIESSISQYSKNQVYSRDELDGVGQRILSERLQQEKSKTQDNGRIAARILIEDYSRKYPLASLKAEEFIPEIENIDFNNSATAEDQFKKIEDKISQKYLDYILEISTIVDIAPSLIKRQTELEDANLNEVVGRFFDRFTTKKDLLDERLQKHLPNFSLDFQSIIDSAIRNKTNLNQEIYNSIQEYCKSNSVTLPKELEDYYGGY